MSKMRTQQCPRAEFLQLLDSGKTTRSAKSAYQWLMRSLLEDQTAVKREEEATTAITTMNLWKMLSDLEQIGKSIGFSIDVGIKNESLIFEIGNIPEDNGAPLLIEELLTIILAKLANVESHIAHDKSTITVRISMQ